MNALNTSVDFQFKAKYEEHTSRLSPYRKNVQMSPSFLQSEWPALVSINHT